MRDIEIGSVPVNDLTFQNKVYAEVQQQSLTENTYVFFKTIADQSDAANSIFQPVSGKLPGNFRHPDGSHTNVMGIFYAAGTDSKAFLLTRHDVPPQTTAIESEFPTVRTSCLALFPDATNKKPWFWED